MITMNNTSALNTEVLLLYGLSTDEKPIDIWADSYGLNHKVGNGSRFYEMDTVKSYAYDEEHEEWVEVPWEDNGSGGSGEGSGEASLSAELTRALNVTKAVGGIVVGTNYFQGKAIEDILHDMLDPVAYPTLTNPSATLAATGNKILETGSTLNTTMTVSFNRGSISPAYGTNGYRSGEATGYSLNNSATQSSNFFSVNVTPSNKTFTATVTYAAGEQPKDSTGANYRSPLSSGSVVTNTITYEFVDALYANTSNASTMTKQSLVSKSTKNIQFNFPATTADNPEQFDIPSNWTLSKIEVLNTLSNQWEVATSQFTATNTTHNDAAGTSVNYKRYTCNLGFALGARKVKVYWS